MSNIQRLLSTFVYVSVIIGSLSAGVAADRERIRGVFVDEKDLAPDEMAHVRQFARQTGREPWLVYGFRYGLGAPSEVRHTEFDVYLQPDIENGSIRRGRMLRLDEPAPPAVGRQAVWQIESTTKYAQVVDAARRPEKLFGKWDLQRPFVVDGQFDDESLIRLVALIRSNPEAPPLPGGGSAPRVNGSLPISHVERTDNGVEVRLNVDEYHGESVTLENRNGALVIVRHGRWIV